MPVERTSLAQFSRIDVASRVFQWIFDEVLNLNNQLYRHWIVEYNECEDDDLIYFHESND